jgi:hypothetical protein
MVQQIQQMIQQFGTPEKLAKMLIKKTNNPMLNNLVQLAEQGNNANLESFAENVFKERGRDFNKEFSEFMKNFN